MTQQEAAQEPTTTKQESIVSTLSQHRVSDELMKEAMEKFQIGARYTTDCWTDYWNAFKNWSQHCVFLRTIGGLLCVALYLKYAIIGVLIAFFFKQEQIEFLDEGFDKFVTKTWNGLAFKYQVSLLLSGIFIATIGPYISLIEFVLFPVEILGSIAAVKLGMDLALKNIKKQN